MTVSRTVPSRRTPKCRITPSFFAPSASMARCDRKLNPSVRSPTTLHRSASNAWRQQQELARRVDVRALTALRVERVPDLHAVEIGYDVVITRRADDGVGGQVAHGPRQHVPIRLPLERIGHVRPHGVRRRHGHEPELPQSAVSCNRCESVVMLFGERLEPDAAAFENGRLHVDHGARVHTKRRDGKGQAQIGSCPLVAKAGRLCEEVVPLRNARRPRRRPAVVLDG